MRRGQEQKGPDVPGRTWLHVLNCPLQDVCIIEGQVCRVGLWLSILLL